MDCSEIESTLAWCTRERERRLNNVTVSTDSSFELTAWLGQQMFAMVTNSEFLHCPSENGVDIPPNGHLQGNMVRIGIEGNPFTHPFAASVTGQFVKLFRFWRLLRSYSRETTTTRRRWSRLSVYSLHHPELPILSMNWWLFPSKSSYITDHDSQQPRIEGHYRIWPNSPIELAPGIIALGICDPGHLSSVAVRCSRVRFAAEKARHGSAVMEFSSPVNHIP